MAIHNLPVPGPVTAHAGRDGRDRITLDVTSMENPAVTLRVPLTPLIAARLADTLYELSEEHHINDRAYAFERASGMEVDPA